MERVKRQSVGGMALHKLDTEGKMSTIHVIYEMEALVSRQQLEGVVQAALLDRFPRFRGRVDPNDSKYWLIPERADAKDYVVEETLTSRGGETASEALHKHFGASMRTPVSPERTWEVHLVSVVGGANDLDKASDKLSGELMMCALVWKISHHIADGVVITQIMSQLLCEPLKQANGGGGDKGKCVAGRGGGGGGGGGGEGGGGGTGGANGADLASTVADAGWFERVCAFLKGLLFVALLPWQLPDTRTPLQLGPWRWSKRRHTPALAVSERMPLAPVIAASKQKNVKVNDLLLTAVSAGIRTYLDTPTSSSTPNGHGSTGTCNVDSTTPAVASPHAKQWPRTLNLTATSFINTRSEPTDFDANGSAGAMSKTLTDYASMKGRGYDASLCFLKLPCGEMELDKRLSNVSKQMRSIKLSPEVPVVKHATEILGWALGIRAVTLLFAYILGKITTYISNVLAPKWPAAFCGSRVESIYFFTAPIYMGINFNFLSYDGKLTLTSASNTIDDPQRLVKCVQNELNELVGLQA